ncbi:hypothetical protein PEX1_056590 [Penicillium expansum]|uniref:NADH dehydrogenase [ubiquinone] 1 beta subcomplex subunit 2 n=1 Tax=Penicillium expansum TaxID=27334 RepID=A0A0A2IBT7_PENEN|nr:hypothetical protein PEX2_086280 [Penicillium expansum]KGO37679.1 hypothetical protein PEX1_056590 [Penicillium expansum]KGO39908.1 hypothetical protein PEXP_032910 [Penicillium expansum]KGO55049.1 hypothetical protein PEX2_086280 [Penicillium expansum]
MIVLLIALPNNPNTALRWNSSAVTANCFPICTVMAGNSSHPIHIHPVRPLYRFTATALGASMWFFLMYRAKKDGAALLGWKHPWDH